MAHDDFIRVPVCYPNICHLLPEETMSHQYPEADQRGRSGRSQVRGTRGPRAGCPTDGCAHLLWENLIPREENTFFLSPAMILRRSLLHPGQAFLGLRVSSVSRNAGSTRGSDAWRFLQHHSHHGVRPSQSRAPCAGAETCRAFKQHHAVWEERGPSAQGHGHVRAWR